MQFPVPAYTSFEIPTGAVSGARITFNEDGSGEIRVYNEDGDIIARITGKDQDTGAFQAVMADGSFQTSLQGNGLHFFKNTGLFVPMADFAALDTRYIGWNTILEGGVAFDTSTGALVGIVPGTTNTPQKWVVVGSGGTAPAYSTNFSGGSTFSANAAALQFRKDTSDNLYIAGAFHSLVTGTTLLVFTLPAQYRPQNEYCETIGRQSSAGATISAPGLLRVEPNGNVSMRLPTSAAVNDNYYLSLSFPMGNIP